MRQQPSADYLRTCRGHNHAIEDPGAYRTVMMAGQGEAAANSEKKDPPTGTFYTLALRGLVGDTFFPFFPPAETVED